MATIVETAGAVIGVTTLTQTTLNGTLDTFTFKEGQGQILILRNPTAAGISPIINGSANAVQGVQGLGSVNTTTGYAVGSIPLTTGCVMIPLDTIAFYLKGTISITSGSGLVASLIKTK